MTAVREINENELGEKLEASMTEVLKAADSRNSTESPRAVPTIKPAEAFIPAGKTTPVQVIKSKMEGLQMEAATTQKAIDSKKSELADCMKQIEELAERMNTLSTEIGQLETFKVFTQVSKVMHDRQAKAAV